MPIIKEQDLLDLHDKIKKLEEDKERIELLQERQLKKITKKAKTNKKLFVFTFIFLILSIASTIFLYLKSNASKIKTEEEKNIVKEKALEKQEMEKDLFYKIQICAFKNRSVNFESVVKHYDNTASGFHEYSIGSFDSHQKALDFVRKLDSLGIKGLENAHIVAFYKDNEIDVRDAIHMQEDNENQENEQQEIYIENEEENLE